MKPTNTTIVIIMVICILAFIIVEFSLNVKNPYPKWIWLYYQEPYVRFISYIIIYLIVCFSPIIAILLSIIVVFLHIDIMNLGSSKI